MLWGIGRQRKATKEAHHAKCNDTDAERQTNPLKNVGHPYLGISWRLVAAHGRSVHRRNGAPRPAIVRTRLLLLQRIHSIVEPDFRCSGVDEMKIDLGGLHAVIETYIGHTNTDLIIRIPDQNIVFTGDLLVNSQYMTNINGYPTSWRATTAKFAEFDKSTIFVPGHGQLGGQEIVKLQGEVFDDIAGQAEKLYKAGVPAEEATERYVIPEKYKTFRQFSWGFCIGRTIEQFYAEWSGKPVPILNYS